MPWVEGDAAKVVYEAFMEIGRLQELQNEAAQDADPASPLGGSSQASQASRASQASKTNPLAKVDTCHICFGRNGEKVYVRVCGCGFQFHEQVSVKNETHCICIMSEGLLTRDAVFVVYDRIDPS